jgi:drug/metabolite transporter (DMT)-like permease
LSARLPILWCLLAALLFGASTPLAKLLLADMGPFVLAGLLYLGAAFTVLPAALAGGSMRGALAGRNLRLLLGAIVFGGVLGPVLLLEGLSRAHAGSVSLWLNLETVATALLAWLFFKEDLGKRAWLAVALVACGGALLTLPFEAPSLAAAALVGAACLCWGLDNNFTALIDGLTPSQSTLAKGLVAGSVNLAIGVHLTGSFGLEAGGQSPVFAALALGGLSYGVSITLYIRAAQQLGAARSQLIFSAAPFLGLALSWGLLAEPVLWTQVVAGLAMAGGILLMLKAEHGHEHHHDPLSHTHSHSHDDGHHTHSHEGQSKGHRHTHPHEHSAMQHSHPHHPDLHHRHAHPPGGHEGGVVEERPDDRVDGPQHSPDSGSIED